MNVLYVSYDGVLEPLGQSQVLRYLEKLSSNHRIILVSYEKPDDWCKIKEREVLRARMKAFGITWVPLRYHRTPSGIATAFDVLAGIVVGAWLTVRYRIKIVHARSYVPSVIAIFLKKVFKLKYIFDMRGFWADERVEGNIWPRNGYMYRIAKMFEKKFLINSDVIVSLTYKAVEELKKIGYLEDVSPQFEVITTCTDLDLFNVEPSTHNVPDRPFTVGYVGSVGVWYMFDETLRCFKELQKQIVGAHLHILNRGDHDYIRQKIDDAGIGVNSVSIETTDHVGVVKAMHNMDVGIFIIKPVFSKLASAPTKLGEFLGCGIPCMGNTNVGDMADILEGEKVGVALESFDTESIRIAVSKLVEIAKQEDIHERCRNVALSHFSLEEGVRKYDQVYNKLSVE